MPDLDLDRVLAPLLGRVLAEPEPMSELERRASRVRRRRWATRLGGVVGAVAFTVIVVAVLPDTSDQVVRTTPLADAPPLPGPPQKPGELRLEHPRADLRGRRRWRAVAAADGIR